MSRTTRLFRLMDALRARRRPVTAADLAQRLSVSSRTVYRDIQTLIDLGAGIEGEAGVGYVLRSGFFLPPLMFGDEELEALVLGARWVQGQGDAALALAATSALARISSVSPRELREKIAESALFAPRFGTAVEPAPMLAVIREAIRRERKLQIRYSTATQVASERVIWPIALAFFESTKAVAAWCELRQDFRHFRTDRISDLKMLELAFPEARSTLARRWRAQLRRLGPRPAGS